MAYTPHGINFLTEQVFTLDFLSFFYLVQPSRYATKPEGYIRQLIDYMICINGGVLKTSRLIGSMPNSAMGVLRTKSGLNYTQAPKSDMFLSDTKNMLSPLMFDCAEIYIDTSTYFHKAGDVSKYESIKLVKIDKEMDEYCSMKITFDASDWDIDEVNPCYFRKGDIIQLEGKEWLARDRYEIPSGVPMAFTVMEDSKGSNTVRVSPGITPEVDVPDKDYILGAKARVVPDHCKAFFWWQPASIFKIEPIPKPSTNKYLYKEISVPSAAFGPTKNNAMSFLVDSRYVFMNTPYDVGEIMAYMYSDYFPFFVGTLILPPKSPSPETYIKTIKNLSPPKPPEKNLRRRKSMLLNEVKTYDDSFSNLLVEIQGMLGLSARRDVSEHYGTLDLRKRLFWEAFDQLHENYYWFGFDVIKSFKLSSLQTVGGGYVFDDCNKVKPAFDVNLTQHKNFYVVDLIETSSKRHLRRVSSLQDPWVPSYILLTCDTCREIKILPPVQSETSYLIYFKDAGVVPCEKTGINVPVGLDGLRREFLKYATASKLAVRLNIAPPYGFNDQYREIKNRLSAGGSAGSRGTRDSIWINKNELF